MSFKFICFYSLRFDYMGLVITILLHRIFPVFLVYSLGFREIIVYLHICNSVAIELNLHSWDIPLFSQYNEYIFCNPIF